MKRITSILLAIMMVLSCTIVISAEDTALEITKQPTADDMSVEVNVQSGVKYQWYVSDMSETDIVDIDDTIARLESDTNDRILLSSYDKATNTWTPVFDGALYTEIFYIFLYEGQSITAEFGEDLNTSLCGLGNYTTGNAFRFEDNGDGTYTATVKEDGEFVFFVNNSTSEPVPLTLEVPSDEPEYDYSVKASVSTFVYEPIEGETKSTLSKYVLNNSYYCEVTSGDEVVKSAAFKAEFEITHQPNVAEPYVEVNLPDQVESYQWQTFGEFSEGEITTANANPAHVSFYFDIAGEVPEGIDIGFPVETASYDKETGWSPAILSITGNQAKALSTMYGLIYFTAIYKADTTVTLEIDEETSLMQLWLVSIESEKQIDFVYDEEIGEAVATIPESGEYVLIGVAQTIENNNLKLYGTVADYENIDGESGNKLSEMTPGDYYRCVLTLKDGTVVYSASFEAAYQIISQPTAIDPTIEVTFDELASFQWYEAIEDIVNITEDDVDYAYGSYDSETGLWTGEFGDPYDYEGYQEYHVDYFDVYLEAGNVVTVTLTNPDAVSPSDPDVRFYHYETDEYYYYTPDENGKLEFTVPVDGIYEVYQYCKHPETTQAKFFFGGYKLETSLEGETDKTLKAPEIDKYYAVTATYKDGTVITSDVFLMEYAITKQPNAIDPSVEVNFPEMVESYEWFTVESGMVPVTDENAEISSFTSSLTIGYYDAENGYWVPSLYDTYTDEFDKIYYEYDMFHMELKAGDTLVIIPSAELKYGNIEIWNEATDRNFTDDWSYEDGVYMLEITEDGLYWLYTFTYEEDITFEAHVITETFTDAIEGEDTNTLRNPEYDVKYVCAITFENGTTLISDSFVFEAPDYIIGDVNNDGAIDQYDYILVKRHYFATRLLTDTELAAGDVNGDGVVNQYDYILIRRHYFGTYVIG